MNKRDFRFRVKQSARAGFTLVEVMIAIGITMFALVGLFETFVYSQALSELSRNKTIAISEVQGQIETIHQQDFDDVRNRNVAAVDPDETFHPNQLTGRGTIYIDEIHNDLLEIKVLVCWRDKFGRIIGEDVNLNGVLDGGEDQDGNGELDSPVSMTTVISRR